MSENLDELKKRLELYKEQEEERRKREEEKENALPWIKRMIWRKLRMYKGWTTEEMLEQVGEDAAITRSHYFYRVLNTPSLGVVDIDFNPDYSTWCQQAEVLSILRKWVAEHPELSWRAYKTAGGIRLIRTDAPQPLNEEFDAICQAVGADDLYRKLCREQGCFRVRLTPKPRRCGIEMPLWNPYDCDGTEMSGWSDDDRPRVPIYIKAYEILADQYKVCELIEIVGSGTIHPDLRGLVDLHDTACKVFDDVPLEEMHHTETAGPRWIDVLKFHVTFRGSAMEGVFQPSHNTPDRIWAVLSGDVQCALKELDRGGEACRKVQDEDRRQEELAAKWGQKPRAGETKGDLPEFVPSPSAEDELDEDDFFKNLARQGNHGQEAR